MFRIKICGITNGEDAAAAAAAGADAIGLNFYPRSPRHVSLRAARRIAAHVPANLAKVGLFVNATAADVRDAVEAVGLDLIQLHGDEPPDFLSQVAIRPIVRAFRCRDTGLDPAVAYLAQCRDAGCLPRAALLDAYCPGQYGGTGTCLDWHAVRHAGVRLEKLPVVLAGGLDPDNVAPAIAAALPAAVDVAGGVELSPGRKCPEKLRRFVAAARDAFERSANSPQPDGD